MDRLMICPLGPVAQAADKTLRPLMHILMELNGTPGESPNETHRWNNVKFRPYQALHLKPDLMTAVINDPAAWRLNGLFRHLPIIGWQKYVVIEPICHSEIEWYVGWLSKDLTGASRLKQRGPVKLLLGPDPVNFFGLDLSGQQIPVRAVHTGRLGYNTHHAHIPLR